MRVMKGKVSGESVDNNRKAARPNKRETYESTYLPKRGVLNSTKTSGFSNHPHNRLEAAFGVKKRGKKKG